MWDADAAKVAIDDAAFSSARRAIDDQTGLTGILRLLYVR
jgi:hypothetical protein